MGRPIGATTRPQFHTYTTEIERREFVAWVKKHFKKNPKLAMWYGDQLFGKAAQSVEMSGKDGEQLVIQVTHETAERYGIARKSETSSK